MWNDTDIPLAYLITFRTYGTWLHGDARGSVNRFRNQYKSRRLPPEPRWLEINTERLAGEIVLLNAVQRNCIEAAIKETCTFRKWDLLAINVRTNHVHTVASIGSKKPEIALNAFKANPTRRMRESGCWIVTRARGRTKEASDTFGMNKACSVRLNMFFLGRVMTSPISDSS
jgi:REP element-mobilizing transposase RayT